MSDHPEEAERNLKRIRICDDICLDVFHLLTPAKVGLELALISHRFDALVDTHFKSRKWAFGRLNIYPKKIVKTNNHGTEKELPFPQKPLPISIVGFSAIVICSINCADAIAFLQRIGRLLESDVSLGLSFHGKSNWNTFATSLWPLLNVSAIIKLFCGHSSAFQNFRRFILPSILRDFTNLRFFLVNNQFLQFPPDDSEGSSDGQVLCKWLHTPRADSQPKVLKSWWKGDGVTMDALKTTFLSATTPVSFIIYLFSYTSVGPFELVNSLTREQLTSRRIKNGDYYWWLIKRSQIDKSAKQWTKWEKEALEDEENDWKVLGFE